MAKNIKSGFFSLQPMHEYAKNNMPPQKGEGRGAKKHPSWSPYSQVRDEIMADVPAITGWYIWLKVPDSNIEEIKYVGKTTQKKMANLQTRLYDHFKRERLSFWREKYKFSGCTHLAWVGYENLPNEQVENVERHLIKWFKPTNNKVKAKPKGDLELAERVRKQFELLFFDITNVWAGSNQEMIKPLTIKKFAIKDRQKGATYNVFAFKKHLDETGLSEKFEVKDKKWGGRTCTYRVYVEGKREETKLVCSSHFTSGLELNTNEIAPKLKEMANQNPDGNLVFEILTLS